MAKRKTREELDAEMGQGSPEPVGQEPAIAEAEAPRSLRLMSLLESLLFAAEEPLPLQTLHALVSDLQSDLTLEQLKDAVEQLRIDLREQGRGIRISEIAGAYQLRTPTEAAPYIKKMVARRPPRLTRATLETLAIVAYRQPVTRGEVEDIRGVDSGAVLKHLLDKRLVKILGRKDEPGRPLLYGTTKEFLGFFSMKDLKSLPTLKDFAELTEEHRAALGLGPKEAVAGDGEDRLAEDDFLSVEETDAYAPVGEDEVMLELSATLQELKQKDRELKKTLPVEKKKEPETEGPGPEAAGGEQTPGSTQPADKEPGRDPTEGSGPKPSEDGGG